MTENEMLFLIFSLGVFALYGGVLAWTDYYANSK